MPPLSDGANDVYASYLIYDRLLTLARDRSINLNLDEFCSNLGDIPRQSTGPITSGPGSRSAVLARRMSGSLGPTPAQERTLGMFISGQGPEEIAATMGIKHGTVLYVHYSPNIICTLPVSRDLVFVIEAFVPPTSYLGY